MCRYQVTVLGSNFGAGDDQPEVKFTNSDCYPLVWTSDSSVVCFAPRGIGTDIPVSLAVPNGILSPWRSDGVFTYDRPRIRQVSADTGKPYTYNFEGGEILTVFGTNFDYRSNVYIGKRTGRTVIDYDPWSPDQFYDCGMPGTFYINSTESPDPCYEPPKVCKGGADHGRPCVGDQAVGDTCGAGARCEADWCGTPEWWGARKSMQEFPEHCLDKEKQMCDNGQVACDPCSLMCLDNWYTKYQSAHKVCSIELLKCELPAEGGRFNLMVELAGQESDWGDCSDADIECSKRTCTSVCKNGPRVRQRCTTGKATTCQGGTERDGQFCKNPAAPVECGDMAFLKRLKPSAPVGKCDWECPPGECPPGQTCTGQPGACESELSYCDRVENEKECMRSCFEFRGRAIMIIFDRNRQPSEQMLSGMALVKQPVIALIDDLGKAVILPSIYSPYNDQDKTGEKTIVKVSRIDVSNAGIDRALGGELNAVVCGQGSAPNLFSNTENPCFEPDQPLDPRFTMGSGRSLLLLH